MEMKRGEGKNRNISMSDLNVGSIQAAATAKGASIWRWRCSPVLGRPCREVGGGAVGGEGGGEGLAVGGERSRGGGGRARGGEGGRGSGGGGGSRPA